MVAGSMVWMAASARPAWAVRAARAAAHSSSRRILRGIVSPSRRSTTSQLAPSSSPSPTATTAGTGTPAAAAARSRAPSIRTRPSWRAAAAVHLQDERARRAVRGVELERAGDARGAAGEAPQPAHRAAEPAPERGRHLVTAEPWRHPYSTGTTGLPPSSSWCRYSAMP